MSSVGDSDGEEEGFEEFFQEVEDRWKVPAFPEVLDLENRKDVGVEEWKNSIIGKLFAPRWIEIAVIEEELKKQWNPRADFNVHTVAAGLFRVTFNNLRDLRDALNSGPWSVKGFIFSVHNWKPNMPIDRFPFNWIKMWVQIFGLPVEKKKREILMDIGKSFGGSLDADVIGGREGGNPYGRVLVKFHIKPKEQTLKLGGYACKIKFRYENIPIFCYFCGLLGHDFKACSDLKNLSKNQEKKEVLGGKESFKFNKFMRAVRKDRPQEKIFLIKDGNKGEMLISSEKEAATTVTAVENLKVTEEEEEAVTVTSKEGAAIEASITDNMMIIEGVNVGADKVSESVTEEMQVDKGTQFEFQNQAQGLEPEPSSQIGPEPATPILPQPTEPHLHLEQVLLIHSPPKIPEHEAPNQPEPFISNTQQKSKPKPIAKSMTAGSFSNPRARNRSLLINPNLSHLSSAKLVTGNTVQLNQKRKLAEEYFEKENNETEKIVKKKRCTSTGNSRNVVKNEFQEEELTEMEASQRNIERNSKLEKQQREVDWDCEIQKWKTTEEEQVRGITRRLAGYETEEESEVSAGSSSVGSSRVVMPGPKQASKRK